MDPNDIHLLVILGFMVVACGVLIALLMLFCLSTLKTIRDVLRTMDKRQEVESNLRLHTSPPYQT